MGREPSASRMSSAGWVDCLCCGVRRPALRAAVSVWLTSMALAKSPESPGRAGRIAQGRGPVCCAHAHIAQSDVIGVVLDKREVAMLLHLEAVKTGWPGPAELLQGVDDGEGHQPTAAVGGALALSVRFSCQHSGHVGDMGPRLFDGLLDHLCILRRDQGALSVGERGLHG